MGIIEFLNDYSIQHWEAHSIVSQGYIGLLCPFCMDHEKPFLGIRKDGLSFNSTCWRCGSHSSFDTVSALTGISNKSEVYDIIKKYKGESTLYSLEDTQTTTVRPRTIVIPGKKEMNKVAKRYLEKRGFNPVYLFEKYHLRNTLYENPSYRIVFPFIFNGREVSWTARDFTNKSDIRYISCSKEKEIIEHKTILYNYDNQKKGGNILLVEGILDAIRTGGAATAGTSYTMSQILLLRNFKKVFIMFDGSQDAIKKAHSVATILSSIGVDNEVLELEEGEDPDTAFQDEVDLVSLKRDLHLY